MSNDSLFMILILLLSASSVYMAFSPFAKRVHKAIPNTSFVRKLAIGDAGLVVLLSVMDCLAFGANWYLLNYRRTVLNAPAVRAVLIVAIVLLLGVAAIVIRQAIRTARADSAGAGNDGRWMLFIDAWSKMGTLAIKNIRGSGFRSVAIFLAVAGVAGFLLATTLVIAGAQHSLEASLDRLGADILVVPKGAEIKVESALLMATPTEVWMSRSNLQKVSRIPGVAAVSPQVFLASMFDSPCCSVSEMFIVVYDPATDLTISPWLEKNIGRDLEVGEVIGGTYIFVPEGSEFIEIYGYNMTLRGNLEPTGTGIDQTLFMAIDTAQAMSAGSATSAMRTMSISPSRISTITVRVLPGFDAHQVAAQISRDTDAIAIESPDLFGSFRKQMTGLLWGFFALAAIIWVVAMVLIGIVFSMAANERRREIAVLRALGATRDFILLSVMSEAVLLALGGAVAGIAIAGAGLYMFKDMIAGSLQMPFLFPSLPTFIGLFIAGVALAIVTVALSALIPAMRLSRHEPAIAMRE